VILEPNCFHRGYWIRIKDFSPIFTHPGSRGQKRHQIPEPGSGSATLVQKTLSTVPTPPWWGKIHWMGWALKIETLGPCNGFDMITSVLRIRILDPGSGIRCLFDTLIRNPWWVKSQAQNQDYFSDCAFFLVKILQFFDADPGCKKFRIRVENIRIRDGKYTDLGSRKKTPRVHNTG
jgi:hypothetical protein